MTDQVDDKGYFILDRHAVITFRMQDISDLTLSGFSIQNVISGLQINRAENGYVIALGGCFGIEGIICAGSIQIDLEPGQPPSQS